MQPGDEQLPHDYVEHFLNGKLCSISLGNSSIPVCPNNLDYKRYLEWKATGLEFERVDDDITQSTDELRKSEYEKVGCTIDAMIVALWEKVVEDRPEAMDALQALRESVKAKFPK